MPITFSCVFARKFNSLAAEPLAVATHGNHDPHAGHDQVAALNETIRSNTPEGQAYRETYQEILVVHRGTTLAHYHFPDLTKQAEEAARGRLGEAVAKADYHRRVVSALESPAKALKNARQDRDAAERELAAAQEHLASIAPEEDPARIKDREAAREASERYAAEQAERTARYYAENERGETEATRKEIADRQASEKAAADRSAADLALAQQVAADRMHAAKVKAEKAAADRAAADRAAAEPPAGQPAAAPESAPAAA